MGAINRFNLDELIKKFKLKYFFETGTLRGEGVDYALASKFEKVFSIEIEEDTYKQAEQKYKNNDRVKIIFGDSSKLMTQIVEQLPGNTLFWLDAHFPGADVGIRTYRSCLDMNYDTRLPLETELTAIASRNKKFKDVIIADDLWIYKDGEFGAGTVDKHCAAHGHNITKLEIAEGKDIKFAYDLFSKTHDLREFTPDQGYLVIHPKQ
jgi:hypothetical protein